MRRIHWKVRDWRVVESLLRWLHAVTDGEAHDAVHDLTDALGGPSDWLHAKR